MSYQFLHHSPLGDLVVTLAGGCITCCRWQVLETVAAGCPSAGAVVAGGVAELSAVCADPSAADIALEEKVHRQFDEYFSRRRTEFSLPVRFEGTPFRCRVWELLREIPCGQTVSYRTLAERAGNVRAVRAVAQACHFNPVAVIVPCHRVIGADGSLTGYAAGLDRKRNLLELEGALPGSIL